MIGYRHGFMVSLQGLNGLDGGRGDAGAPGPKVCYNKC